MNAPVKHFDPSLIIATSSVPVKGDKHFDIYLKSEVAIENIYKIIESGKSVSVHCSYGKDSSVLLVLALEALRRAIANGIKIKGFYVSHADTGIENPAMGFYCKSMTEKLEQYAEDMGFYEHNFKVLIATPSITSSWVYSTIGRGRVPVFADSKERQCTVDFKVRPQQKLLKELIKKAGGTENHVSLIGTRLSESADRKARMEAREETSTSINKDGNGFYSSAPIADWDVVDVWSLMMSIDAKRGTPTYKTYVSDFEWTLDLYKDANEGTCAIIVGDQGNKAPCGVRFGCAYCTVIKNDSSLESQMKNNPEAYSHMENVNKLRNYLVDTQKDLSKRTIYGQSISKAGYINCRPDNYNWVMRRRLLQMLITLDVRERERAEEHTESYWAGELDETPLNERLCEPQFEYVSTEMIVAIDFIWSLQSVTEAAFPAMQIWFEINNLGKRYDVPVIDEPKKDKIPAKRWLYIGDEKAQQKYAGLRDVYGSGNFNEEEQFSTYKDAMGNDQKVTKHETAKSLEINTDEIGAFVHLDFESLYYQIDNFSSAESAVFYLKHGFVKIAKGKIALYDKMARRYQILRDLHCIHKTFDIDGLLDTHTISNSEHSAILEEIGGGVNVTEEVIEPISTVEDELTLNSLIAEGAQSAPEVNLGPILVDPVILEAVRSKPRVSFEEEQFSLF